MGTAALAIIAGDSVPAFGHIGITTPLILAVYAVGMRSVFLFQKRQLREHAGEISAQLQYEGITAREAALRYGLNAAIIIVTATWLPFIGERLADETGLGRSFVGAVLIAMTTSLPEVVVSITALRIGAADMAIGNLLGSNMFNIAILAVDDIAYRKGPILALVSFNHVVTAGIAIVMTGIAVVSLTYRIEKKTVLRLGWDALALLLAYFANVLLMYALRGRG
jgi:cation:H+ antiporter